MPRTVALTNCPNPFNSSTTISFTVPYAGLVSLTVHDVAGRKVTELARGFHSAEMHLVVWKTKECASGVYFCMLRMGEKVEIRKMLLVK